LFADLVGFTSMAEARDPEHVKNLVDRCFQRLRADIEAFGGRVDKIVGDAILALFGAPLAHEDDAERAVRAGLAMQRTLSEWAMSDDERALHGKGGTHGTLGVVFVGDRRAEQSEDGVADDLVDLASVCRDVGDQPLEGLVDDVLHLLGIAGLRETGEADEIGKKDRDDPPLVRAALHRGATGRAEARTLHQRGPTRRACHGQSLRGRAVVTSYSLSETWGMSLRASGRYPVVRPGART